MSINLVIFIYMEKTSNLVIGNFFNLDVDSVNVKPLQKDFLRSFVSQVTWILCLSFKLILPTPKLI